MITLDLRDPHLLENFEAVQIIRSIGLYTDEEIQEMYNRQLEKDAKDGDGNG